MHLTWCFQSRDHGGTLCVPMVQGRLETIVEQQALTGVSRENELELFLHDLELDANALGKSSEDLIAEFQRGLRTTALTTLEWRRLNNDQRRANGVNGGVFVLSRVEDDEYRLDYGWFEYGAMDLGRATVHELGRRAEKIARQGGPFGGPVPGDSHPLPWYSWHNTRGTLRRGGYAGEFLIDAGPPSRRGVDDHELICAYRDGSFSIISRGADRSLVSIADKLAEDEFLRERRPPVTARVGELTVPWRFLDHPLFRGIIAMPAADLLLVNQPEGDYGILLSGGVGHHYPFALRSIEMLQEFDVAPLMEALVGEREFAQWLTFIDGADHRVPASGRTPTSSSKKHVAPSLQPADRGPTQRRSGVNEAGTDRPPESGPRPIDLDDLVLGHLKAFHAEIPSGEGGSATARALLLGIVNGYLRRVQSVEGTWREVLAPFVEAGDLDDMPSDKTARAALNILKASPIVRRVDHQRWRICLDECRDPKSEVVAQLLGMFTARPR